MNTPYPIEVKNLSVNLGGREIIDIPSLQVPSGEVTAIMGPNGSGKTTFLLTLALLLKPATGQVLYHGNMVTGRSETLAIRRRNAVVFQEALLLNSSVWDNVTIGMRLRGIRGEEAKVRARRWLERFGVAHLAGRAAKVLSGGESKRVSLARAFALEPEVLFLDEPFNGLDTPTRQSLVQDFQGVLHETGVTTVLVTHEQNEALALADRIVIIMEGKIRASGSVEEVFSCTEDEELARFIDRGNVLRGFVISQDNGLALVKTGTREVAVVSDLPAGTTVAVCLPYEDTTLLLASDQTVSSARNRFTGPITRMLPIGSQLRVTVDCGFPLVAVITRRSWDEMGLRIGGEVTASFKASSVNLIPH